MGTFLTPYVKAFSPSSFEDFATPHGCKQSFEATLSSEKPVIKLVSCKETFEGVVHGI